jgi:hypothetical protein
LPPLPNPICFEITVVGSARNIRRIASVLFFAGLWALTSVWTSAAHLTAERAVAIADDCCESETSDCLAACSCCTSPGLDSAEPATRNQHALFDSSSAFAPHFVTEVDAPATSGSVIPRRHDIPRSARGPPGRG